MRNEEGHPVSFPLPSGPDLLLPLTRHEECPHCRVQLTYVGCASFSTQFAPGTALLQNKQGAALFRITFNRIDQILNDNQE